MNDCTMVLIKTAMAGVVLLVMGVLVFNYGGQFIMMMVQSTQRTDLEPHVEFRVGEVSQRSYSLPATVTVFGVVKTSQPPTNESSDVRFLVFDDLNYQKWNTGAQADSAYSSEKQGQFNYTFTTTKSGAYHFVFDNRASMYKKYVAFSISYNEVVRSQVPDSRFQYVAWAMLVGGAILLVYGLVRKPPLRWA
ncbi:MAG TPA: hypothetical protein VK503_08545 [Candidatus Bathyarchaeia archaeon]|nr:hypothetical protein [Candidatus Bathyarchaeia archaeon]